MRVKRASCREEGADDDDDVVVVVVMDMDSTRGHQILLGDDSCLLRGFSRNRRGHVSEFFFAIAVFGWIEILLPQTFLLGQNGRDDQPPLLDTALFVSFVDVTFDASLAILIFLEASAYVGLIAKVLEAAYDSDGLSNVGDGL